MSLQWSAEFDGKVRSDRIATEYEFLGEPTLPSAGAMNERIAEMRQEIEEDVKSIRTLLAMARLSLLELE